MAVQPALTGSELTALAGPSAPRYYLVYDDAASNPVGTARVNAPSPLSYPLLSVPIDGQSANWNTIQPGMVVLIGSTAGGFDRGIFRVRWNNFLTFPNLEIMAIGESDSGEINIATRNTTIQDDDYVTVLDRFDPFGVFPRINYPGTGETGTIYEDWDDLQPLTANRYPPPIVNLIIDGQASNYASHVFNSTSKTINIQLAITLWPTSSSVNWTITLPGSWTLNSGSLTGTSLTSTINVTIPHSANVYTLQVVATENNGTAFTAYRKVWIKSYTYPPLNVWTIDTDVDDRTGSRRTITLTSLQNFPPSAMIHLFDAGTWNASDVPTARKCFTGYIQNRREISDTGLPSVSLDLIGPAYVCDLIGSQSQIMYTTNGTVGDWQTLYYQLAYLDFIIWWILLRRASGFLQMFNYTPFGFSNTQKRLYAWQIDTGTLLQQLKAQAARFIGGNIGCDPGGEFMLRQHPSRVPFSSRGSIPIRATVASSQRSSIELDAEIRPQVRRLRGETFIGDALTKPIPYWCDAPRIPGQGAREDKIDKLICDSTGEFYEGVGDEYQARNNLYPNGRFVVKKNWPVIYPAQLSRINIDISANVRYDNTEYTGYVVASECNYSHNQDGTIDTEVTFEAETVGVPAINVPIPLPASAAFSSLYQLTPFAPLPTWVSINPNPAGTKAGATAIPKDGSVNFAGTAAHPYVASHVLGTPLYRDVTPSDLGSFQIQHGVLQIGGTGAWILGYDGTNSAVWYTANVFVLPSPSWSKGANISGKYTTLRTTNTAGTILISQTNGQASVSVTYPSGTGPSVLHSGDTVIFTSTVASGVPQINAQFSQCITFVINSAPGWTTATPTFNDGYAPTCPGHTTINNWFTSAGGAPYTVSSPGTDLLSLNSATNYTLNVTIGGLGNALVAKSTNNGSTWSAPVTVSSNGSDVMGFDTQHNGTVSLASGGTKAYKATTLGGSYSLDQSFDTAIILIECPWGKWGSTTLNNTGSSPDYVVGLGTPDTSNHTLYKIATGSQVNITPMIGGNPGIPVGPNCLTTYLGIYIALLASFGGTTHLVTSSSAGSTWTDRGALDATYARVRRLAATPNQIFLAGNALDYTNTFGAKLISKTKPSSAPLIFWESYY